MDGNFGFRVGLEASFGAPFHDFCRLGGGANAVGGWLA